MRWLVLHLDDAGIRLLLMVLHLDVSWILRWWRWWGVVSIGCWCIDHWDCLFDFQSEEFQTWNTVIESLVLQVHYHSKNLSWMLPIIKIWIKNWYITHLLDK